MRFVPFDLETVAFSPGNMAPAVVTAQWDDGSGPQYLTRRTGAVERARQLLTDPDVTLVGHAVDYDMACLCAAGLLREVFAAYADGRVVDTWVYERLGEIAGLSTRKKLDLATTCAAHGIKGVKGDDPEEAKRIATSFGQFIDATEIPEPWLSYLLGDCVVGKLFERQHKRFAEDVPWSAVQQFSRMFFALRLMSVWGLKTSPDAIARLTEATTAKLAELRPMALEWGFLRDNGTRNMAAIRAAVEEAYGPVACPRTPTGRAQTSSMAMHLSEDARLMAFEHYGELLKLEGSDLPLLRAGILHPRFTLADTGRTICSKPNIQNLPGKSGARECIVPRAGNVFIDADYAGIELCTFAQVCVQELGDRRMADMINASGDPGYLHAVLGARLARVDSAETFMAAVKAGVPGYKDIRTRAKNANFGFMGGMGWRKFVDYVWLLSKGTIKLTQDESRDLRTAWGEANPCGPAYLDWVARTELPNGTFEARIPGSNILRRGLWYSAAANSRFQGLAAAVMAEMLWRLARSCYLGDLRGCRPVAFIHDQVLVEAPEHAADEADRLVVALMRDAARDVLPDVLTKVESNAAACYSKDAARVVDARGRLTTWRPASLS